ncbi:50S ribosomal protein L30 [Candidatus Hydrogenosomobacter endosymbioticus]|uniref:50S ribosomal protein L30 n=1 Tax=Candidatus Hydrogenosomobacter endosymbioticus TaxID=2558174 RepID=A0ABN6L784_9PROT|nr:50S ribosomal protein L30 [Candidatus Hydrogenosomobacter endosymbioticus]BDB96000.1 hypothetical protein HYD_1330 [Candidatus Hydrogenosomobacter endosymbioticus]
MAGSRCCSDCGSCVMGCAGGTVRVRQVRSLIREARSTRGIIRGLGLGKIGAEKELPNIPEVIGMVRKVLHLVEVY